MGDVSDVFFAIFIITLIVWGDDFLIFMFSSCITKCGRNATEEVDNKCAPLMIGIHFFFHSLCYLALILAYLIVLGKISAVDSKTLTFAVDEQCTDGPLSRALSVYST